MGKRVKGISVPSITILLLLIILIDTPIAHCASTEWSNAIASGEYHWTAEKNELNTWQGDKLYDYDMLGGTNVPGGDNALYLNYAPSDFDIFAGDRLDIGWIIEGDMAMPLMNDSDVHLAFLPLRMDGSDFFEQLFTEQETLEALSRSEFVNSTIESGRAIARLKFNDTLDVVYEWDTSTGLLSRKVVTAPSAKQLIVVPGRGTGFFAPDPTPDIIGSVISVILLFSCFGLGAWLLARRNPSVQ